MKYLSLFLIFILFSTTILFSQNCDCTKNFEWVKKTFEENDAGFEYALEEKGMQAYETHNKLILAKIKKIKTLNNCTPILYEWLSFFRSGHVSIKLNEQNQLQHAEQPKQNFANWETVSFELESFKKYLAKKVTIDFEGIWETFPYQIGVQKIGDQYLGFIIESGAETWTKGQVKFKISIKDKKVNSVFYMRDHSAVNSDLVRLIGNNFLQIGQTTLVRKYPELKDEPKIAAYFKTLNSQSPYMDRLNENTLYLRIPSFLSNQKQTIDSVLHANEDEILRTENLIIDIRSGTGGSDDSYAGILPFIYTNPIRTVGVEFLSTKLNNQRMLDFIHDPEYGFSDEDKIWAQASFDKLEKNLGGFVNLEDEVVSILSLDTVFQYPKNVGIIINEQNGSTDEQFLLEAKQSKKVKLFGTTTYGVLDVSNMYFVTSPCKEFELGYALTRSMRIPDYTIDAKGIQPDYFIDTSIEKYDWTEFTNAILNGK